jgi:hypothetical protein
MWREGEDTLTGLWTGGYDEIQEWENAVCDIDVSTGTYFESYRVYEDKSEDPNPDGVQMLWCQLTGDANWWEGSWDGIIIPYADNPDLKADNGNCYLVYELNGTIECSYSLDGRNFRTSIITNDGKHPSITAVDETVVCSYTRNGNLYTSISENGGSTWVETQVNDENDKVVEQKHCNDVSSEFIVWTDSRNGYYSIYLDKAEIALPNIEISISGGLGVSTVISNTGDGESTDLECVMTINGGILGRIDKQISETLTLGPGEQQTINSGLIFGLGSISISVTAGTINKIASGTQLLIFSIL